ncbi:ferritin-like domain-containing protein [Hymenobacter sp. B1770]|uniref:ferritin-like domain-containing protein n=1 Tax=Hymenobacter sp. B1770 TaxID=1718788 RepID=UPI003CF1E0C3
MEAKATQALLNELVETLKDGQKGYADAMTDVDDARLKDTFKNYSAQRSEYITEIEDQMFKLNLKPDESGSVTATVHRAWIDLKAALTSKNNNAVLNECERGEEYAVKAYQTALKAQDLPSPIKSVIEKQYQGVQEALNTIKSLKTA